MANDSNITLKKMAYYVGIVMVGVYFLMGLSLIFTNVLIDLIPRYRVPFGCFIILYAIFRLYMSLRIKREPGT